MREIENPFVEEVLKPEDTQQSVVVKNIDYKKKDVYKHDILLHCCPEKSYHKVGCSTEPASGTQTGVVG